jgi:hypothetical protein
MSDQQHQSTINQLAALFRSDQPTRPVVLLGAGASFSSGVPTAAELVQQIVRLGCAIEKFGDERRILHVTPTDTKSYCQKQDWWKPDQVADCFPYAVESILTPPERRRRHLIKWTKHQRISTGYDALAKIVSRRLCWTVLTTNFDSLIIDSLGPYRMQLREILELNRTRDDLSRFKSHNRCQIVYLHGAVDYYTDCNLIDETQKLNSKLAEKIWPLLSEAPLIVVGYRGSEPSIMEHLLGRGLEKCDGFKHGIFWCHRGGSLHPSVLALSSKMGRTFRALEIKGFDELFVDLEAALVGDSVSQERADDALPATWDATPAEGWSMADINTDELRSTLLTYWKEVGIKPPAQEQFDNRLLELQLVVRRDGNLIPTNACALLFGRNPGEHYPHAAVSLRVSQKKQSVFSGNLVRQFAEISAALNDIKFNPTVRLKSETASTEKQAFPPLALRELLVNLLVHRDYQASEISVIEQHPGVSLEFRSPGGLPASVRHRVSVGSNCSFTPVRGQSECRNSVIADIFCGLAQMDKAGSGLPDVELEMPKHGGRAEFYCEGNNTIVAVKLLQAEQRDPKAIVAVRKTETEVYTTNLLPLKDLPSVIYVAPLLGGEKRPLYQDEDERDFLPLCIRTEGQFLSFGDFRTAPAFARRHSVLEATRVVPTAEFLKDPDHQRHFSWLVGRHWDFFLDRFAKDGLFVDYKKDRVYFKLMKGESNVIHYKSRLGRQAHRAVVKMRQDDGSEYENEGFFYEVFRSGQNWGIQVKPTYVFTGRDGFTPLPPMRQTSKATRRIKFDRNKSVDDDLAFWSRYLGADATSANLGRGFGDDFIIELRFIEIEQPIASKGGSTS